MPKEAVSKRSAKSENGKRTKKDKTGPKRGLSAYMFFSQEMRPKVKEENPDASFGMAVFWHHFFYLYMNKLLTQCW